MSGRWKEDTGAGVFPPGTLGLSRRNSNKTYLKWGAGAFIGLLCVKFLFFTDPLALEDILPFQNKTMAQFDTKYGRIVLELFPEHAPLTVEHFKQLVERDFYSTDTGFYRSEPGFVLQAGGFIHDKQDIDAHLPVEYSLPAIERAVVLARQKHHQSGNSEFAIMLADNSLTNKPSDLDQNPGYTTFGHVFEGWGAIQRIVDEMSPGFLKKQDKEDAITFKSVSLVQRLAPTDENLRRVLFAIQDHIETPYSVVIFSKTTCPYCKKAKKIIRDDLKAQLHVVELDLLPNGPMYQDCLEAITGQRTVPNVFVNQKSIGGGDDTADLYSRGILKQMIFASGALAKTFILDAIKGHPCVVFSKATCPFCKKAKKILLKLGATMKVYELDQRQDQSAIQYYLYALTGRKTVPNVFINGESIGGGDETERLEKSGELKLLLQSAGAFKK